jgi:hypothetical protein
MRVPALSTESRTLFGGRGLFDRCVPGVRRDLLKRSGTHPEWLRRPDSAVNVFEETA